MNVYLFNITSDNRAEKAILDKHFIGFRSLPIHKLRLSDKVWMHHMFITNGYIWYNLQNNNLSIVCYNTETAPSHGVWKDSEPLLSSYLVFSIFRYLVPRPQLIWLRGLKMWGREARVAGIRPSACTSPDGETYVRTHARTYRRAVKHGRLTATRSLKQHNEVEDFLVEAR